jgi:hypothetical protein
MLKLKRVFKTEINHFRFNAPTIDIPVSFNFKNRIEFWNWYKQVQHDTIMITIQKEN